MIGSIHIKNFKSITDLKVKCFGRFNVIIGTNNIGKTSIFEAIHLWKMCYDQNLKKDKTGFYAYARNLPFKDMEFIRVYSDMDLYPVDCAVKDATTEISLIITYQGEKFNLGFLIRKVTSIDNAYLQISYVDGAEFKRFEAKASSVGKKLDTFLTVNESRPVANIIAKEPYMYKAQVKDKIAKGKGYEVLRNKLRDKADVVQTHINNVLQTDYKITEVDKDNKQYISMQVDGKNILSYGSGFLQLAEIFSSIEYLDSEIGILLIDEPDAHMHLKMQKRLIDEFRTLSNTQLFIITHNDRFLEYVEDCEILFLNEDIKKKGIVTSLPSGCKGIVMENLGGSLKHYEQLRYAKKLILVEGPGDKKFLDQMCPKYEQWADVSAPMNVIIVMEGIDKLNDKLKSYAKAVKEIIPQNCSWLLIRDTDCVPLDQQAEAADADTKSIDTRGVPISVVFQDGYGIESSFLSEKDKLARLMADYYELSEVDPAAQGHILKWIQDLSADFSKRVVTVVDPLYKEWEHVFQTQKDRREENRVYKKLRKEDVLRQINESTIQYIMTKRIMNMFLKEVHQKVVSTYPHISKVQLGVQEGKKGKDDYVDLFDYYYSWMKGLDDMFEAHKSMLCKVYSD